MYDARVFENYTLQEIAPVVQMHLLTWDLDSLKSEFPAFREKIKVFLSSQHTINS